MGCCFSRSSGPNSPYPGGGPNSSARAINPPPLSLATDSVQPAPQGTPSPRHRRRRDQGPLDQQINHPLRRHEWACGNRRWTRRELARERADFFDTRVSNRPEVWQTLHAALQALWEDQDAPDEADGPGEAGHDEGTGGLEGLSTAQTILSAAEISLPTGDLANGAYDPLGNYYQLPEWVVSDPVDVADDTKRGDDDIEEEDGDDEASEEAERRREEKGKAVVDVREQVTLRARLSESGRDYQVTVGKSENVSSVARKIAHDSGLASTKKIRIAYMGKMLKENASLEAQGWQAGHVVNALVFNR